MLETIKYLIGSKGSNGFGSKSTAEQVTEVTPHLQHITTIITGGTSGLGAETARVLAKHGARIILPTRNFKACVETKERILFEFPNSRIIVMALDLSSLASVRSFVSSFESLDLPLNLLINNAGRFSYKWEISEDGVEMTFATNYLGHFLLTKLLLKTMVETAKASGEGRIINVSSSIHSWFKGDAINYLELINKDKSNYDATRAYALSKLAMVLHAKALTDRLKKLEANVTVNCLHPGTVKTRLNRDREGLLIGSRFRYGKIQKFEDSIVEFADFMFNIASKFLKTIPQAAATTCYVATHPKLLGVSGKYFVDCNEASTSKLGSDANEAVRLWIVSEAMTSQI